MFPLFVGLLVGYAGGGMGPALMMGLFAFVILSLPIVIGGLITKSTTEVALTNQRVILKWGFIRRNTIETYLDKIEGIVVDQSLLGRILGYGSVSIRGTGGGQTPCPGIARAQEFRRAVNEQIQQNRFAPTDSYVAEIPARPDPRLSPPGRRYFFTDGPQDSGPHALDEMRGFVKAGKVTANTLVFKEGDGEWRPVSSFPELSS